MPLLLMMAGEGLHASHQLLRKGLLKKGLKLCHDGQMGKPKWWNVRRIDIPVEQIAAMKSFPSCRHLGSYQPHLA
jgi:hypothetical protein